MYRRARRETESILAVSVGAWFTAPALMAVLILFAPPASAQPISPFVPDPQRRQDVVDWLATHPLPSPPTYNCDNTTPVPGTDLPECFMLEDLSTVDFSRLRAQGCCGSCHIFAIVATMEAELRWRYRGQLEWLADPANGSLIRFPFDLDLRALGI